MSDQAPAVRQSAPHQTGAFAVARLVAADIKVAHSVFALPFAVLAVFLARPDSLGTPGLLGRLVLVVACMVFARTWAMLVNRLADRELDAANPRTAGRALASGRLRTRDGVTAAALCALAFLGCTALFGVLFANWWPTILAVPVLGWIAFYSFTKRFTALCHIFLGGALAASPICAAIAIDPHALGSTPSLWWLAGMVLCWVAGFDVIYALQDLEHDRTAGLSSIPAALGPHGAAIVSRGLHTLAAGCLILAWCSDPRLGVLFAVAVAAAIGLLVAEHIVLIRRGLAGLDMAFFTINGVVSCLIGVVGVADILL